MKSSALIAMLLVTVTFLSASTPDIWKCREFKPVLNNNLSILENVEQDLMNGTWILDGRSGSEKIMEFNQNGTLGILIKDVKGHASYESSKWRVQAFENRPFLVLNNHLNKEKLWRVEQTCEGIVLADLANNETLYLNYRAAKKSGHLKAVKTHLAGEWTNVTIFNGGKKCENTKGAYLGYQFTADGTYICKYGSGNNHIKEKGQWELSKDCQFLLLHENDGGTKVIRIEQVDDHGLILEQVMKTNEISEFFCSSVETFAFIK